LYCSHFHDLQFPFVHVGFSLLFHILGSNGPLLLFSVTCSVTLPIHPNQWRHCVFKNIDYLPGFLVSCQQCKQVSYNSFDNLVLSFCYSCHCCGCNADPLLLAEYLFASVDREKPWQSCGQACWKNWMCSFILVCSHLLWFCEKVLGTFANCKRCLSALSCLSVHLSVHMEQLGSNYIHFHEMWYLSILQKPGD
jgi:hypothetical protein